MVGGGQCIWRPKSVEESVGTEVFHLASDDSFQLDDIKKIG